MLVKLQNISDIELLTIACEATGIVIKEARNFGKFTTVQVSVKDPASLYLMGLIQGDLPSIEQMQKDKEKSEAENLASVQGYGKDEQIRDDSTLQNPIKNAGKKKA